MTISRIRSVGYHAGPITQLEERMKDFRLPIILLLAWGLGFGVLRVGGAWIHAVLVLAAIALVWRLVTRGRVAVRSP